MFVVVEMAVVALNVYRNLKKEKIEDISINTKTPEYDPVYSRIRSSRTYIWK